MSGAGRPLRVAITMFFGVRHGGSEQTLWTFLQGVDRTRVEPAVWFFRPGPFTAEVAALGIPVHVHDVGRLRHGHRAARAIAATARGLRHARPDLAVHWMMNAQLYGAPAAALAGLARRTVWWQHALPDGSWPDRLAARLPAAATLVAAESVEAAQSRVAPRRRIIRLTPGVPAPARPAPDETASLRARLGIPSDRPVVGIVGRLQPWKAQDRLLEAAALMRSRGTEAHVLVVGGDAYDLAPDYAAGLRAQARRLGLDALVSFTGQVPSADAHLALMDVAVNASAEEPFGLTVLEAMAAGVPVVAVDSAGPREILSGTNAGVLVASNAPRDLAGGIEPLLHDGAARGRMGEEGRRLHAARYTPERAVERITVALEELAR